jgi:CheY-like chemotaxis protein
MRILIVDDDTDTREVLSIILQVAGYDVRSAADGMEALRRIQAGELPSLILLDLMMPRMDGPGLVQALQRIPGLSEIPFVVISGDPHAWQRATQLGAADCLVKPIDLERLLTVVRAVASSPSGRGAGRSPQRIER